MQTCDFRRFSEDEDRVWTKLFNNLAWSRNHQAISEFTEGLDFLGIDGTKVPNLDKVNEKLLAKTGWQGVPVEGLEEGSSFYAALADRKFPIGNFLRDEKDLSYTPAPDIFHDLYGHIPLFVNPTYADFCQRYGELASRYTDSPGKLRKFERFFWFTVEFGLVQTPKGRRIFGAGILSSQNECNYSLSEEPEVIEFDLKKISEQEFDITKMQERLFILESETYLYESLGQLEALVSAS